MRESIQTGLQVTLLLIAATTVTAQEADVIPEPEITPEAPAATAPAQENTAPGQCPTQPEKPVWWGGAFTATYEKGDLVLEPDVPRPAGSHAVRRTFMRAKTEYVRGEYTLPIAGQLVRHTGRYMVSRFEPVESVRSLEGELVNPVILRTFDNPIGGRGLSTEEARKLAAQSETPVNAYFVNNTFDAQQLRLYLQSQSLTGEKREDPNSVSEDSHPEYIVVVDEIHDYQEIRPAIVKEVTLKDGTPTAVCEYENYKYRLEQRTGTRVICETVYETMEQGYTVEINGKPETRTRTVQVERPSSRREAYTYSVRVPVAEVMSHAIRNPQLLMPVNPQKRSSGRAFAPVEVTPSSLPLGTRVFLVNSPAEAGRVYETLRNSVNQYVPGDLPFALTFLVDYESAEK